MALTSRSAIRTATNLSNNLLRSFSTSIKSTHHNNHQQTHTYLEASAFVGSWEAPKDPEEAQAKLALLRRDYAKQVKQVRKNYIQEVELLRLEKQRKDEAKREALRVANEERKKLKAEAAKARAEERKVADEEFRRTLVSDFLIFLNIYIVRYYCLKILIGKNLIGNASVASSNLSGFKEQSIHFSFNDLGEVQSLVSSSVEQFPGLNLYIYSYSVRSTSIGEGNETPFTL